MSDDRPREKARGGLLRRAVQNASERVVDIVDPDSVLAHIDVEAVLERVDIDALLARVDVNELLDRVDTDQLLDRVDVNRLLDRVEPDQLLDRVDVNRLLDRVEIDRLLDRVGVDRLMGRVDVDALLKRVDVDALVARVDVDGAAARVDVNALMDRVDVRSIVDRAGIPEIVADSTAHLTGSVLDVFRRLLVGLDEIVFRSLNRLVRRDPTAFPTGPGKLVDWVDDHAVEDDPALRTGRYAGPVTRLIALILDSIVVTAGFTLSLAGARFLIDLVTGGRIELGGSGWPFIVGFVVAAFLYLWLTVGVFGKTLGKAVTGLAVVGADGSTALHSRQAAVRALVYPLSFAILGLGLVGVVFGRERRAWHDRLARTAVVYDWGSRTARLSTPLAAWLNRRQSAE